MFKMQRNPFVLYCAIVCFCLTIEACRGKRESSNALKSFDELGSLFSGDSNKRPGGHGHGFGGHSGGQGGHGGGYGGGHGGGHGGFNFLGDLKGCSCSNKDYDDDGDYNRISPQRKQTAIFNAEFVNAFMAALKNPNALAQVASAAALANNGVSPISTTTALAEDQPTISLNSRLPYNTNRIRHDFIDLDNDDKRIRLPGSSKHSQKLMLTPAPAALDDEIVIGSSKLISGAFGKNVLDSLRRNVKISKSKPQAHNIEQIATTHDVEPAYRYVKHQQQQPYYSNNYAAPNQYYKLIEYPIDAAQYNPYVAHSGQQPQHTLRYTYVPMEADIAISLNNAEHARYLTQQELAFNEAANLIKSQKFRKTKKNSRKSNRNTKAAMEWIMV